MEKRFYSLIPTNSIDPIYNVSFRMNSLFLSKKKSGESRIFLMRKKRTEGIVRLIFKSCFFETSNHFGINVFFNRQRDSHVAFA